MYVNVHKNIGVLDKILHSATVTFPLDLYTYSTTQVLKSDKESVRIYGDFKRTVNQD